MAVKTIESTVVTKKEFSDAKTELDSKIINTEYKALNAEVRMTKDISNCNSVSRINVQLL